MTSENLPASTAERSLSPRAIALMLMLCLSWGFNQIAVKLALPDIPPLLQGTIRSVSRPSRAAADRALSRRERSSRATARFAPACFSGCRLRHRIRADLSRAAADVGLARGGVSLYRAVFRRAWLLTGYWASGCAPRNGRGSALSFAGVALAIGMPQADVDAEHAVGRPPDRRRRRAMGGNDLDREGDGLQHAPPEKPLIYQVAISIPILGAGGLPFRRNPDPRPGPLATFADRLSGGLGGRIDVFALVGRWSRPIRPANCRHLPSSPLCLASWLAISSCMRR